MQPVLIVYVCLLLATYSAYYLLLSKLRRAASKQWLLLTAWCILPAILMGVIMIGDLQEAYRFYHTTPPAWREAPGSICKTTPQEHNSAYAKYQVDGREYTACGSDHHYRLGDPVPVHYYPETPGDGFLNKPVPVIGVIEGWAISQFLVAVFQSLAIYYLIHRAPSAHDAGSASI